MKFEHIAKAFENDRFLWFQRFSSPDVEKAAVDLLPTVQKFANDIDKTKITHTVRESKPRNWFMRVWDLSNQPIEEIVTRPALKPKDQYETMARAIVNPEYRSHIPGAQRAAEYLQHKVNDAVRRIDGRAETSKQNMIADELIGVSLSLTQLPTVYHRLYLDVLTTDQVNGRFIRRWADKKAFFTALLADCWQQAGCKTLEDIRAFETKQKHVPTGTLRQVTAAHSHKPVISAKRPNQKLDIRTRTDKESSY